MKRLRNFCLALIAFMLVTMSISTVNASTLQRIGMRTGEANYIQNNLNLNLPMMITYKETVAVHNATRITTLVSGSNTEANSTFYGPGNFINGLFKASARGGEYYLYRMNSADAYVSAAYDNVGTHIPTGKPVSCVMTISNYKTGNRSVKEAEYVATDDTTGRKYLKTAYIGFFNHSLSWILLDDGLGGLNADIEVYFYYSDDPTKTPIDLGEAYIGVGGMSSEKRLWNPNAGVDEGFVARYASYNDAQLAAAGVDPGINGAQWEWVSYDSNVTPSLKAYYISEGANKCFVKYITSGQTVLAEDQDTTNGSAAYGRHGWAFNAGNTKTFGFQMTNPTGHNVISNGGTCFDTTQYADISEFTNFDDYSSASVQKQCYMIQVARVTKDSEERGLVYSKNRTDGQPFSVYKFIAGKDVGSVEEGLNPISICNEATAPVKKVDKTVAHEQENITYTLTQKVGNKYDGNMRITQQNRYDHLTLRDSLPEEVQLLTASVYDEYGTEIARFSSGAQTSGRENCVISCAGNQVTCDFTQNYLRNTMRLRGEEYKFVFTTKVKDLTFGASDFIAKNKGSVTFDNEYTLETNEVQTKILYDILTKGVHTTISDRIVDIMGGTSGHEVKFTPELGYYVEKVEWQNQSPRYDLATTPDIPSNNKKTIPETKDGSESGYKHTTEMTGKMPHGENNTFDKTNLNYDPFGETKYIFNNIDNNHYVKVTSVPMQMVVQIDKEDVVTGKRTQGDATFEGAQYTIYTDGNLDTDTVSNPVAVVTLDRNGYGESIELPLEKLDENGEPYGEYFIKETKAPEGYLLDTEVQRVYIHSRTQTKNREKVSYHHILSKEEVKKNRLEVIKYDDNKDSTEEKSSKGAILRLTLDSSDGATYYDATINEDGYAEFVNEELKAYYPYTIPYGRYTVTEIRPSDEGYHTRFYIQPEKVNLTKGHETLNYRIFADYEIEAYLKVIKKDTDTNEEVHIAGAKYKIWDVRDKKWVSQVVSPSGEHISEFETNAKGYFITPEKLHAGKYVVYETVAPEGYYLNNELRIPKNEADLGDATKAGVEVTIDSVATGLTDPEDLIYDQDRELMVEMDVYNTPLKAELDIKKTGEMLTEVKTLEVTYKTGANQTAKQEKYTPVYKMQGLPGVTYNIVAATDIKSPDKRFTYVTAGTIVDTVTTGDDGIAKTKALYPGEYEVKETNTPKGYLINTSIPNVELKSENSLVAVQVTNKEYTNVRQKLGFTFDKVFTDVDYSNSDTLEQKALFGVYTKEEIANYKGNIIIPANKLVAFCEVDEDGDVTTPVDLPEGKYEVRELWASYPYTVSSKTTSYELKYNEDKGQEFLVVEGETFENDYERASLKMIKLPSTIVDNVVLDGEYIDKTELDDKVKEVIEKIKTMTEEEVKEYFEENGIESIPGAKYVVYTDEECTNELRIKNKETGRFEIAELVTNETGIIKLNNLPLGEYYVKEVEAPVGYQLSEEVTKVTLDTTNKDAMVYQALVEDSVVEQGVSKVDFTTGEAIPNCTFVIQDEEGQTILRSITNERGEGWIPAVLFEEGKTYTYREIDAPEMYEINEEGFEFVAKFDEEGNLNIDKQKVYNTRKTREVIVRKLDAKTGEPLEGCVFTIAMIDEKTGEQKVNAETGEPIYLVENATTNEDGEYVIEKAPMGTYKFMEIKAPEGYELDEDLTGLTFTIDNNSPETIIFEVTNTGDIAVIALSIIAIVSVMGIVYVLRRKVANKNI